MCKITLGCNSLQSNPRIIQVHSQSTGHKFDNNKETFRLKVYYGRLNIRELKIYFIGTVIKLNAMCDLFFSGEPNQRILK